LTKTSCGHSNGSKFKRFIFLVCLFPICALADVNVGFRQSFESATLPSGWTNDAASAVGWLSTSDDAFVGSRSLRSGDIGAGQVSAVSWSDTFDDGLLTFNARVDSESCCDYLHVYLDDELQLSASGNGTAWVGYSVEIPAGNHTLRFEYSKDGSVDTAVDAAFIDNLRFIALPTLGTTIGNILVIRGEQLLEITADGTPILAVDIPSASSPRGLELLDDGRVAIFDAPVLHIYQPIDGTWQQTSVAGWSSGSNGSYGRIEQVGAYIYATNHAAISSNLIRFSVADLSATTVTTSSSYLDLSVGLDGNLYALKSYDGTADVLAPDDLTIIGSRSFGGDARSVSVNASGQLFGMAWSGLLTRYGSNDALQLSLNPGIGNGHDIDLLPDGRIVVGGRSSAIALTNSELGTARVLNLDGASYLQSFVRFVRPGPDGDVDGLPDRWERQYGLDSEDPTDALLDTDVDALSNLAEFQSGTNPLLADTDDDGLDDYNETVVSGTSPVNPDTDSDALNDYDELQVHGTDPLDPDTDDDELSDWDELTVHATNPLEADSDSDTLPDKWELDNDLNPNEAGDAATDDDSDGLINLEEFATGTNPYTGDTDGDTLLDGAEVGTHLTDPLNSDTDDDLIDDGSELAAGLNPLVAADAELDADMDGYSNLIEFFAGTDLDDATSMPVAESWAMHQANKEHNGYLPLLLDANDFALRWLRTADGNIWNQPVVQNGRVFISTESRFGEQFLKALDAKDGSEQWSQELLSDRSISPGIHNVSAPSIANGQVYIHSGGHEDTFLWSFSQLDGQLLFKSAHASQWPRYSAPTIVNDRVYVNGAYYGGMSSFDALSGEFFWTVSNASPEDLWEPAVDDNYLYVPAASGGIAALNPATGAVEFSVAGSEISTSPVLGSRNNVIAGGIDLTSFDIERRAVNWVVPGSITPGGGYPLNGQPAVALGQVFVIRGGRLYVYEEATGDLLWNWAPASSALTSDVILTASHAFAASATATYAIDLQTRTRVWSYALGGKLALSNEGALFIASGNGQIAAIDIEGDDDSDSLPDWWERLYGLDLTDESDAALDIDADGLTAVQEFTRSTSPADSDTDDDGLNDGLEVNTYQTDPRDSDSDDDQLQDDQEVLVHLTDPNNSDSDADGLADGAEVNVHGSSPLEVDTDSDQIDDSWEVANALNPSNPDDADTDRDRDGLTELDEYLNGTAPRNPDSDNDGLSDGDEVNNYVTNPLRADSDGDILTDAAEIEIGLDPVDKSDGSADFDLDGFNNRVEYFSSTAMDDPGSRPRSAPWSTHQGNASHTGLNPVVVSLPDIAFKWENDLSNVELHQVTAADGRVFVSDISYGSPFASLWTLNEFNGTIAWSKQYADVARVNPPAWANGSVYVQTYDDSGDSHLRAYDAADGDFVFKTEYSRDSGSNLAPTPWANGIYVAGDNRLHAFEATEGSELWSGYANFYGQASPAVTADHSVIWAQDYILIFDRLTGGPLYQISNDDDGYSGVGSTVIGSYSNVIAASAGSMASYNYISPELQWQVDRAFQMQPSIAFGLVFAIDAGALSVRNEFNGKNLWGWESLDGPLINTIAVAANYAFVSTAATTYAISLTKRKAEWSYPKGGHLSLSETGTLLIAGSDGVLVAVDVAGDADNDQLPDSWEDANSLDSNAATDADNDADDDRLTNRQEYHLGTNPGLGDTDSDGMPDGYEQEMGLDALDQTDGSLDLDNDGYSNAVEYEADTDPLDASDYPVATDSGNRGGGGSGGSMNPFILLSLTLVALLRRRSMTGAAISR
jgi:outer membrane protein assembly factor BamB